MVRSRRLAVWLLVGLTAYAAAATAVPQTSVDPAAAAAWDAANPGIAPLVSALGLHSAFSMPLFLAACLLVGVSTAACAWERSRAAARDLRILSAGGVPARARSLEPIAVPDGVDAAQVVGVARAALDRVRLSSSLSGSDESETGGRVVIGRSGTFGLLGSPLFHWAIAGLMLSAAVGQLTRYEAAVDLVVGESVEDTAASYGKGLTAGPFAGGFSGRRLTFEELDFEHVTGEVERGPAPRITVTEGGEAQAAWVFPNHPLRSGSLTVHPSSVAPVLLGTVTASSGAIPFEAWFAFDDRSPRVVELAGRRGEAALPVVITPLGDQRVSIALASDDATESAPVGVGESIAISEDATVTVDELTYGAQIRVVRDATMPLVFAMFLLLIAGSALTVFVPARAVVVEYEPRDHVPGQSGAPQPSGAGRDGAIVRVRVSCPKNDPAFPARVRDVIAGAVASCADDASEERL